MHPERIPYSKWADCQSWGQQIQIVVQTAYCITHPNQPALAQLKLVQFGILRAD